MFLVKTALGGISARPNRHHGSTCSTGKGQKWFFGEPGESSELVRAESPISLIARFGIASSVARECLEAPLHR